MFPSRKCISPVKIHDFENATTTIIKRCGNKKDSLQCHAGATKDCASAFTRLAAGGFDWQRAASIGSGRLSSRELIRQRNGHINSKSWSDETDDGLKSEHKNIENYTHRTIWKQFLRWSDCRRRGNAYNRGTAAYHFRFEGAWTAGGEGVISSRDGGTDDVEVT